MESLPASTSSTQGRNPDLFIADEVACFSSKRHLTVLLTTGAKRLEHTGVLISTPGSDPNNQYAEIVKNCEAVLAGEAEDDTLFAALWGIDKEDKLEDENCWVKGNPNLPFGQPNIISLRRAWNQMKGQPLSRGEFSRYHACRYSEQVGLWLDMELYDGMIDTKITDEMLLNRPCYAGLDLSKSCDATALVLCFPLDDGRLFIKGKYWLPKQNIANMELEQRAPLRLWAAEGKLELCAGREIDYNAVKDAILEARQKYDLRKLVFDRWGAKILVEQLLAEGVPCEGYSMGIQTFGSGSQIWYGAWQGGRLAFGNDPVLRKHCSNADVRVDINGNMRPCKSTEHSHIDGLVAAILSVHAYGGVPVSVYELESEQILEQ